MKTHHNRFSRHIKSSLMRKVYSLECLYNKQTNRTQINDLILQFKNLGQVAAASGGGSGGGSSAIQHEEKLNGYK